MSDERLDDFDSTSAIFGAAGSLFKRLTAFFLCSWLAHYVGNNAASAGGFLRSLWQLGPKAILEQEQFNPLLVPLGWIGALLLGCTNLAGILYLLFVVFAFCTAWLSEDKFPWCVAIILVLQPIESFLAADASSGGIFDLSVGIMIVVTWEIGLGALYWWMRQRMDES